MLNSFIRLSFKACCCNRPETVAGIPVHDKCKLKRTPENRLSFENPLALLVDNLAAFDVYHGNGIIKIGKTVRADEPVALGLAIDSF